jgi:hypothetical protein
MRLWKIKTVDDDCFHAESYFDDSHTLCGLSTDFLIIDCDIGEAENIEGILTCQKATGKSKRDVTCSTCLAIINGILKDFKK